jgi:hypothetical protein
MVVQPKQVAVKSLLLSVMLTNILKKQRIRCQQSTF